LTVIIDIIKHKFLNEFSSDTLNATKETRSLSVLLETGYVENVNELPA
jgi:N-acetylmuramoyl-L-alanine amidase